MTQGSTLLFKIAEAFEQGTNRFATENAALAALETIGEAADITPQHRPSDRIWFDFEEGSKTLAQLVPQGEGQGFKIKMQDVGTSRWFSMSWTLERDTLLAGRYFALLANTQSDGLTSWRPCLRYLFDDGTFKDVFCRDYMVSSGGASEELCFVKIDRDLVKASVGTEAHLFFGGAVFDITFQSLENLLVA